MTTGLIVATIVSAVLAQIAGALWYSKLMFMERWMAAVGLAPEAVLPKPSILAAAGLLWLSAAIAFSALVTLSGYQSFAGYLAIAVIGWLGFGMVPQTLQVLFRDLDRSLIWIDGGYHFVCWLLMALSHAVLGVILG